MPFVQGRFPLSPPLTLRAKNPHQPHRCHDRTRARFHLHRSRACDLAKAMLPLTP
jgi:hypothetical protein